MLREGRKGRKGKKKGREVSLWGRWSCRAVLPGSTNQHYCTANSKEGVLGRLTRISFDLKLGRKNGFGFSTWNFSFLLLPSPSKLEILFL